MKLLPIFLLIPSLLYAQEPVEKVPDVLSYATAAVNPTVAAIRAFRSEDKWCEAAQLGLSELIGNVTVLTIKHFVVSPRPCIGCDSHGMPSGHAMNGTLGVSSNWYVGIATSWGTGELRYRAKRHTIPQVLLGWTIGALSEWGGQKIIRCKDD